jgi:hypothetical protein
MKLKYAVDFNDSSGKYQCTQDFRTLLEAKKALRVSRTFNINAELLVDTGNIAMRWVACPNGFFALKYLEFYIRSGDSVKMNLLTFGGEHTTRRLVSVVKELSKALGAPLVDFYIRGEIDEGGVRKVIKEVFGGTKDPFQNFLKSVIIYKGGVYEKRQNLRRPYRMG